MNQREVHTKFSSSVRLLLALLAPCPAARAVDVVYIGPDLGSWNIPANWSNSAGPDARLNEAAVISNNATVVLNQHTKSGLFVPLEDVDIAGLKLGTIVGRSDGLRVVDGGVLPVVAAAGEPGAIQVGVNPGGTGTLVILGGGTVSGVTLTCAGGPNSSLTLGDVSGRPASLLVQGTADLQRTTTIIGPNVHFSADGGFTLGSTGTLVGQILHPSLHSPLKSPGVATLGGTFRPQFSGVTPVLGNKWSIVDADTITSRFASIDTSAAPTLPAGQAYRLIQTDGGIHGRLLQFSVELRVPADFDDDGDVDGDDLDIFTTCARGPAVPYAPACTLPPDGDGHIAADFDQDGDADGRDYGVFQRCLSGANVPADPRCGG